MKNLMNNIVKSTIVCILSFSHAYATSSSGELSNADTKTGIEIFLTQYDWNNMWKEMSMSGNLVRCTPKTSSDGLVGIKSTLIEPLYLADVTTKKGEVASLGIQITKERPEKEGTATGGGGVYLHIFRFNIMDKLLGGSTGGAMEYEKGNPSIIYLGEMDIKKWNDSIASDLAPERTMYSNVVSVLAEAASCFANETLQKMPSSMIRTGSAGKYTRSVIDSMYYTVGCSGSVAIGTTTTSSLPFQTAMLTLTSVFSDMHSMKGAVASLKVNHTVSSVIDGYNKDIWCRPLWSPLLIMTMYSVELLYPTVSKTQEWGVGPAAFSYNGKGGKDYLKMMFIINQRRDYAAFAYSN